MLCPHVCVHTCACVLAHTWTHTWTDTITSFSSWVCYWMSLRKALPSQGQLVWFHVSTAFNRVAPVYTYMTYSLSSWKFTTFEHSNHWVHVPVHSKGDPALHLPCDILGNSTAEFVLWEGSLTAQGSLIWFLVVLFHLSTPMVFQALSGLPLSICDQLASEQGFIVKERLTGMGKASMDKPWY